MKAPNSIDREEVAALRRQRDLYEGVLAAHGEPGRGTVVVEGQRVRYADASFCDMSGYPREELEAMPSFAHVLREEEPGMGEEDRWLAATGEGESPRYEATLHRKDGRRVEVEVAIKAIAGDGTPRSVLAVTDVSSRKAVQEQVRFQARLLDAVEQAVVATDMRGEVTYWNRAAERVYGWSAEETLGRNLSRFLVSDGLRDRADEIMAEVKAGRTWSGEFLVRRKDGMSFPVTVTDTPVYDDGGGEPVGVVIGISTDLTRRKRAEEALLASETELKTLFWAMTDVILVFDRDGRYLKIAPTNPPLAYRPSADLIGRTLHEVFPKERADEFLEAIRRALDTRRMVTLEYSREIAGQEVWFAGTASPLHDDSVVWVERDITEPKRIEHALRHNEAKYRSLVEQLPALIYIESVDDGESEWDFLYISPQHEKLLGYSAEEWTTDNRFWEKLIHPEDRERVVAEDARTDRAGEPFRIEYRLIARDGRTVWVHDEAILVYDEDGSALFWQGVMYDITEQKRAEEEIQQLNESLERRVAERTAQLEGYAARLAASNRELQEFAYVASHDLQEPLRKVLAFGERLRTGFAGDLGERGLDYLGRMEEAAGRMRNLIEDLLVLSRVTTQANPFGQVELNVVLGEVLRDLEAHVEETGARVEVGELPTIEGDRAQMRQLLQNLISNALKFHEPGAPPIVKVRGGLLEEGEKRNTSPAGGQVCRLVVEDNGIGFDEEHLERIFSPFERLHGRGAYEGTGMGLAICRKVVERHGGHITAKSVPGQGAAFVVTLLCKHSDGSSEPEKTAP